MKELFSLLEDCSNVRYKEVLVDTIIGIGCRLELLDLDNKKWFLEKIVSELWTHIKTDNQIAEFEKSIQLYSNTEHGKF